MEENNVEILDEEKKEEIQPEVKEEVKVETPKKKSPIGLIILIIILMIGCLVGGYFINESGILSSKENEPEKKETKNKKEKKEEKEKSVTFTDEELNKYVSYISVTSLSGPAAAIFDTDSLDATKLSTKEKISYIADLVFSKATSSADYQYSIIAESDVKAAVEEVYGPGTYERTTFNVGCGDYTYKESDGKFYSKTGCGGTSAVSVSNIVIDYKATDKKLEITTAYVFADGMTNKLYKDYSLKNALEDINTQESFDTYLPNYIKNNKDKLNTIVYTFESKDGKNYYFTGFVNNK